MVCPNEGKDKTQMKKYMKKLKKVARAKPNERKVVILDEDIKNYCDGTYKLPAHMMNTPLIVLKQREFDKAVSRLGGNSQKSAKLREMIETVNVPSTKFLKKRGMSCNYERFQQRQLNTI